VLGCFKSINKNNPFVDSFSSSTVLSSVNIDPGALPNVLGCIDTALENAGLPPTGLVPHALDSSKTIGAAQQTVLDAVRTALLSQASSHTSNLHAAATAAASHLENLRAATDEATTHLTALHQVLAHLAPTRKKTAKKKAAKKKPKG